MKVTEVLLPLFWGRPFDGVIDYKTRCDLVWLGQWTYRWAVQHGYTHILWMVETAEGWEPTADSPALIRRPSYALADAMADGLTGWLKACSEEKTNDPA